MAQLREVEILRSLNPNSFRNSARCSYRPQLDTDDNSPTVMMEVDTTADNNTNSNNEEEEEEVDPEDNGIINLIDFYSTPKTYTLVMELARGGDVFDRLVKRSSYTESCARSFARILLRTVSFLHERGIEHRDIKPENLLLMDVNDDIHGVRLADFGFARRFNYSSATTTNGGDGICIDDDIYDDKYATSMSTKCGTPAFVPPELVLGRKYGPKCDMWSVGCTLFMLLCGRPPFNAKKYGKDAMFRAIRAGDFVFYEEHWGHVSVAAKKLILGLLQVDPKLRMSPKEALNSEWMQLHDKVLRRSSLDMAVEEMKSSAKRKLKGAVHAVQFAVGGKFWDMETSSIWRDDMYSSMAVIVDQVSSPPDDATSTLPPTFDKLYQLDFKLQVGHCATVWQGTSIETHSTYAVKVVQRAGLTQLEDAAVMNEVSILRSLRHKKIVSLLDFFEGPECFHIVMEKCNGGDVLDKVASIEHYTEKEACQFTQGLLEGVQFMHSRGIAHRDLKPQNLLLTSDTDNTSVKICDFGYAKRVHLPKSLTTLCGSLSYVAPELLRNHPYDESADMWSVGVIIYFLLSGYLPFYHREQNELFKLIRLGRYTFDSKYWTGISSESITLIKHLLDVDSSTRYTSTQALQSDWIKKSVEELELINLTKSLRGIIRVNSSLKGVVRSVQWNSKDKMASSLTVDTIDFHDLSNMSEYD
jgi:serine/threonine protein kinase